MKKKSVFVYASGIREGFQTEGHLKGHRNAKIYIFIQPELFLWQFLPNNVQTKPVCCHYPKCVIAFFYFNPNCNADKKTKRKSETVVHNEFNAAGWRGRPWSCQQMVDEVLMGRTHVHNQSKLQSSCWVCVCYLHVCVCQRTCTVQQAVSNAYVVCLRVCSLFKARFYIIYINFTIQPSGRTAIYAVIMSS